jgi:hypothetical protein
MHNKALEKLNSLVVGLLKNCQVKNEWYEWDSISLPAGAIAKELAKHKSDYVKETDVYSILGELLSTFIREKSGISKEGVGSLQDLIGEPRLLELAASITDYLFKIPHKVTAELSLTPLTSSVEKQRSFCSAVQAGFKNPSYLNNPLSGGLGMVTEVFVKKNFFVSIATHGAASWNIESTTNRALVSALKIILHHAIDLNLIEIGERRIVSLGLFANTHQISKIKIQTTENAIWERENTIELPLEICVLLGKITAVQMDEDGVKKLLDALEVPARLIESGDADCARIKAAIEWSFDSLASENETMAFLKVCIGLEALLGENEAGPSLTEALSDRCAYLIATSIKGRKNIKDRFKELYKIRSKIVHGAISHLDRENLIQLEYAKQFLRSAIRKEMQFIMPQLK